MKDIINYLHNLSEELHVICNSLKYEFKKEKNGLKLIQKELDKFISDFNLEVNKLNKSKGTDRKNQIAIIENKLNANFKGKDKESIKQFMKSRIWPFYKVYRFKEFLIQNYYRIYIEIEYVNKQGETVKIIDNNKYKYLELAISFAWEIPEDHKSSFYQRFHTLSVKNAKLKGVNNEFCSITLNYDKLSENQKAEIIKLLDGVNFESSTIEDLRKIRDISYEKFITYFDLLAANNSNIQRDHVLPQKEIKEFIEFVSKELYVKTKKEKVDFINDQVDKFIPYMIMFNLSKNEHNEQRKHQKKYSIVWNRTNPYLKIREVMLKPYIDAGITSCYDSFEEYTEVKLEELISNESLFRQLFISKHFSLEIFGKYFEFDKNKWKLFGIDK